MVCVIVEAGLGVLGVVIPCGKAVIDTHAATNKHTILIADSLRILS
jgi:hypothetical protein